MQWSQIGLARIIRNMDSSSIFALSDSAAARIAYLLRDEPPGSYLRVSVDGGGCSGFQYRFAFDAVPAAGEDAVIERAGAKVAVDQVSLGFLKDGMLDYVEELGGSFFEIKNPNATASCGCGNSFAV